MGKSNWENQYDASDSKQSWVVGRNQLKNVADNENIWLVNVIERKYRVEHNINHIIFQRLLVLEKSVQILEDGVYCGISKSSFIKADAIRKDFQRQFAPQRAAWPIKSPATSFTLQGYRGLKHHLRHVRVSPAGKACAINDVIKQKLRSNWNSTIPSWYIHQQLRVWNL
jgi:hypothetical protein